MKQEIRVTYVSGETVTIPVTARVEVEVERRFQLALAECTHREHTYFAAWTALRGSGNPLEFDAWLDTVADARFVQAEGEEPDPTHADPGSATS